jgi:hypothetical protein
MAKSELFMKICGVFAEKVRREHSENTKAVHGMRYDQDVLAFLIAMRGHGHRSAEQYGLLTSVIKGVTARQLRYGSLFAVLLM